MVLQPDAIKDAGITTGVFVSYPDYSCCLCGGGASPARGKKSFVTTKGGHILSQYPRTHL